MDKNKTNKMFYHTGKTVNGKRVVPDRNKRVVAVADKISPYGERRRVRTASVRASDLQRFKYSCRLRSPRDTR